jgi:hypothetical protein
VIRDITNVIHSAKSGTRGSISTGSASRGDDPRLGRPSGIRSGYTACFRPEGRLGRP